jgi:hypothetical protein
MQRAADSVKQLLCISAKINEIVFLVTVYWNALVTKIYAIAAIYVYALHKTWV